MEKKAKILFVCLHRADRNPSQRFRFEQYITALEQAGFQCTFSYLLNQSDDKHFYTPGNYLQKGGILLKSIWKRLREIVGKKHDIVFVQREAFMLGTAFFEKQFSKRSKVVFDFDDSIWIQGVSEGNKSLSFLKKPDKTKDIIKAADRIFAGNRYLADYALQWNTHVTIIPTTIDTDLYCPAEKHTRNTVCIGWSGSFTTLAHFKLSLGALKRIKDKYKSKVEIKVIGDGSYVNEELSIKGLPWRMDTELDDLRKIDIGIMPLEDDEWSNGKCGLKGLQYMSLGIATIMSPVGVNKEIIQEGENGLLATTEDEWVEKLSLLIEDNVLRAGIGAAGRRTVEKFYSVNAWKEVYVKEMNALL